MYFIYFFYLINSSPLPPPQYMIILRLFVGMKTFELILKKYFQNITIKDLYYVCLFLKYSFWNIFCKVVLVEYESFAVESDMDNWLVIFQGCWSLTVCTYIYIYIYIYIITFLLKWSTPPQHTHTHKYIYICWKLYLNFQAICKLDYLSMKDFAEGIKNEMWKGSYGKENKTTGMNYLDCEKKLIQ